MAIILIIFVVLVIPAIGIIWLYSVINWIINHDTFTNNKTEDILQKQYEEQQTKWKKTLSDEEFDKLFVKKPLPTPYKPERNPLYVLSPAIPPLTAPEVKAEKRKRIRDSQGRFISENPLPITRYGVPTHKRFKG